MILARRTVYRFPNRRRATEFGIMNCRTYIDSCLSEFPGVEGSHEVVGKGYVNTKNSQMVSTDTIFTFTYHTKQLNSWPDSLAGCVVNYSQLSACQGEIEPFKDRQA